MHDIEIMFYELLVIGSSMQYPAFSGPSCVFAWRIFLALIPRTVSVLAENRHREDQFDEIPYAKLDNGLFHMNHVCRFDVFAVDCRNRVIELCNAQLSMHTSSARYDSQVSQDIIERTGTL